MTCNYFRHASFPRVIARRPPVLSLAFRCLQQSEMNNISFLLLLDTFCLGRGWGVGGWGGGGERIAGGGGGGVGGRYCFKTNRNKWGGGGGAGGGVDALINVNCLLPMLVAPAFEHPIHNYIYYLS